MKTNRSNIFAGIIAAASMMTGGAMFASAPVSMEFQKPPYLNRQPIIHQPKVSAYQIHCALIAGGLLKGELARGPWRDKNQRQIRKDRRRAFAAGNRKAFK